MIKEIVEAVTIPVMAKVRIGHFVEAQVSNSQLCPNKKINITDAYLRSSKLLA